MSFPSLADKHNDESVFTAVDLLIHRRRKGLAPTFPPPGAIIFCTQPGLLRYAVKKWRGQKKGGFFGDFYRLKKTGGQIGVIGNFGVGAPVTAVLLEDFVAFGSRQFISIGLAGGLQETLQAGDMVVADRAIRDEGVSHHYLPPEKYAAPAPALTRQLRKKLNADGASFAAGASWTTDAPYRETRREVALYQQEGVLTVEMEAAAFFAVAHYLQVEAAAAFVIGDSMKNGRWQLDHDTNHVENALKALFDASIMALQD